MNEKKARAERSEKERQFIQVSKLYRKVMNAEPFFTRLKYAWRLVRGRL